MALSGISVYNSEIFRDSRGLPTELLKDIWKLRDMAYGKDRRKLILKILDKAECFRVNSKYCIQTKDDPDVKKLIKQKKIEMFNEHDLWNVKKTYLRLKGK